MSEPEFLRATRAAYETVAEDYARLVAPVLAESPMDRAVLAVFADLVGNSLAAGQAGGPEAGRPVVEIGCGPGRIAAHLASLGLDVFGVDLSPGMVQVARRAYPQLRFEVGSMTGLDLPDASVSGVVAWYSIIHVPTEQLAGVFAGFRRVLVPGGHLALVFQVGDERRHITEAYGHDNLDYTSYRRSPDLIAGLLQEAGFVAYARAVREPEGRETCPQAYLIYRKQ